MNVGLALIVENGQVILNIDKRSHNKTSFKMQKISY